MFAPMELVAPAELPDGIVLGSILEQPKHFVEISRDFGEVTDCDAQPDLLIRAAVRSRRRLR